ncbi:cofactor-independent phosphoglycerate mutase [Ramaria rubella]|nr:cofactor-independent phosphoglycerate mutase [Ramaria rubella]
MVQVKNKVCLIVHDGWGIAPADEHKGDAIHAGDTTNMDTISKEHAHRKLAAHGIAVGLSEGLMGNSEVGHLNIGAGRIVWQDIVRIDQSIKKRTFHKSENIVASFERAKKGNGRLHLLGLVSDGGVHSHIRHLFALLETAKEVGVPHVYIHFFGDGRDTAPRSAAGYAKELIEFIDKEKFGELATVIGRYYGMDRDKRWERVKIAVDALTIGEGEFFFFDVTYVLSSRLYQKRFMHAGEAVKSSSDVVSKIEECYKRDETDEFLKPIIVGEEGRIKDHDTLFFFNYRSDRMREIVSLIALPDKPIEVSIPEDLHITTMSRYKSEFPFAVAFPPQAMTNVLAEWLAKEGVKQAHIAETEKYAHVTFFFNGGVEKQFVGEERHMIPSPKVPTYDKQPEMSVQAVADKVAEVVKTDKYEFVMCNFAPPDMVGHTGVYDAAVKAISATDAAVGTIYKACQEAGYVLLVTADHGNAEQMLNAETGAPHTAHTTNPVPFIIAGPRGKGDNAGFVFSEDADNDEEAGSLGDVAPTVLEIMGLPQPEEMTGRSLLVKAT